MSKVWIVFRTVGGKEKKVKRIIENLINSGSLGDKVSRVVVPFEIFERRKKTKNKNIKVTVEKPKYKGYVFVEMEEDDEVIDIIKKATSAQPLLSKDEEGNYVFITLSDEEIRKIEDMVQKEEERKKFQLPFFVGDRVKIISGPFANWEGKVIEVYPEKSKIKVLIDFLGKSPVEIDFLEAERI
jgi:transcriptional antiterminator NusG